MKNGGEACAWYSGSDNSVLKKASLEKKKGSSLGLPCAASRGVS